MQRTVLLSKPVTVATKKILKGGQSFQKFLSPLFYSQQSYFSTIGDDEISLMSSYHRSRKKKERKYTKPKPNHSKPEIKSEQQRYEDKTAEYLAILDRIKEGYKNPKSRPVKKSLDNSDIDTVKVESYISRINECVSNNNYKQLCKIYNKIFIESGFPPNMDPNSKAAKQLIGKRESLLHLDLYQSMLLAFGSHFHKLFRMMTIYKQLKWRGLPPDNATLQTMVQILDKHEWKEAIRDLWKEYLNDFRKGKIPQKPTVDLFNVFFKSFAANNLSSIQFQQLRDMLTMMTKDFANVRDCKPNSDTFYYILKSGCNANPPRYMTVLNLCDAMSKAPHNIKPETRHYAQTVGVFGRHWVRFNDWYIDEENLPKNLITELKSNKGTSITKCHRLLQYCRQQLSLDSDESSMTQHSNDSTILDIITANDRLPKMDDYSWLDSHLLTAIIYACASIGNERMADEILQPFLSHNAPKQRRLQLLNSEVLRAIIHLCGRLRNYEKAIKTYAHFLEISQLNPEYQWLNVSVFNELIEVSSYGLLSYLRPTRNDIALNRGVVSESQLSNAESILQKRLTFISNAMRVANVKPNQQTWANLFFAARRIKSATITKNLLSQMEQCWIEGSQHYFEMNFHLLQMVISALYDTNQWSKALELYQMYYNKGKSAIGYRQGATFRLFDHYVLQDSGQREIDFHTFRTGFAITALRYICQYEFPPLNISKFVLATTPTPDIWIIVGVGKHNAKGVSVLQSALSEFCENVLSPPIQWSIHPHNEGMLVLNGSDVHKWRVANGFATKEEIDTVVNWQSDANANQSNHNSVIP